MSEIYGPPLLPPIPDDLTIPQFFLDSHHTTRPVRKHGTPWFIEDKTGRSFGFEEARWQFIRARTFGMANSLRLRFGIKEDDVVLIYSPNHIDYPVAIWATHRLGAIVSGANPMYTVEELLYQIETTKASIIITHPMSLDNALSAAKAAGVPQDRVLTFEDSPSKSLITVEQLILEGLAQEASFVERKLNPGEARTKVAFLNFSSGTTGKPKAVLISHYGPITNVIQTAVHMNVNQNYCAWEDQRFRPGDVGAGNIYGLVISIHFMIYSGHPAVKDFDLSHVRVLLSGAAPLSAELMNQLVKLFPKAQIGQGYGLTESSTSIAMLPPDQKIGVPGSVGRLLPGVVARIVKPDGSLAGFNEPGELTVKMSCMALGYFNNEKATRETFVDGWLRTGDEVIINDKGDVFIVDRLKEILKVRGFQVAPAELEGCLLDHPDVADTCVVSVPHDYSGEVPLAYVVLHADAAKRAEADPAEANRIKASIAKHVADNKVAYKRLEGGVEFTDIIPKNPSGKMLRRVLRDRAHKMRATKTKTTAKL
ncbi:hypothetical protein SERLADRAFT_416040 [Serpula lacrymans var. lacrymans S7.9]|uniref:Uncharacterized protein n=1 Tax=Serpula lacrymans var. lacrymans (strain S7.9) TaxID=578457 RepID=F8NYG7_SERL9|nr:uncharacterized protein SERLADRAFT_416040 [Serpula lacrymans var. lacrymans S7.9]EGO23638.1 hypothetical protein SERLADRAFT_416040 [Serpula lacrymans var. lacrymans S7.9]